METDAPQVGGYRLLRRLGSGGMGTVHEAVDADGRHVAVKIMHPHIAEDPDARRRLTREVELLHRVRGAGVARVLDAEVSGAEAFVVTELIDGPTLEEDVASGGPFAPDELAPLAEGLATALGAIHAVGVVHRDLKPGNVMLADDGPVLIDFGIAQVADDARLTQTGMVTGTPGYLAPEVLDGGEPDVAGDWWAWAAVLTFAATGRPPFGRGPTAAVLGRVATGQVDTAGLAEDVAQALRAALHPDPARRLPHGELLAVLQGGDATAVLAGEPTGEPPEATRPMAPRNPVVRLPGAAAEHPTRTLPQGAAPPSAPPPAGAPPTAFPGAPGPGVPPTTGAYTGPPQAGPWAGAPTEGPWGAAGQPPAVGPGAPGPWTGPYPEAPTWARAPRRRSLLVGAAGLALSTVAVWSPGLFTVAVVGLVLVMGTAGWAGRSRRAARLRHGLRRGDDARMYAGLPWHLLRAALSALPGLAVGGFLGAVGLWLRQQLLERPDVLPPGVTGALLLWGVGLVAVAVTWLAPTSGPARDGARATLAVLTPTPALRVALGAVLLLLTVVTVVQLLGGAQPDPAWAPLPTAPFAGG